MSPIPASSGKTNWHLLNWSDDRQANAALHSIVVVRLRHDPRTKAYMHATTGQAYPAVRPDDVAAYAIGLPEPVEQMTIANALDRVDATITDA